MVILLSVVAIAALLSFCVVPVVSVCACASWLMLIVYFPVMAFPEVVALKAVELLVVDVAVKRSALFKAVFAVWNVSSALFNVP